MASGQQIELGDLLTNSKGGRFLPLRGADGAPPSWLSPEWLKIIWHPAAYGDQEARRVNVCFEPDAAAADFFAGLERELVDRLAAKSAHEPKIFNKALARPEIEARMQSCLKTSQRGSSFLKAKLNWDRVRFWDAEGQPLESPGDLAGRLAKVRVELRQVWLMSPQCGLLLEVTDLQLREAAAPQAECPF